MSTKKIYLLASLGLLIPIFLISMAYIAVKSDQKNQEKYKQQQAEILQRIADKKAAEQKTSLDVVNPQDVGQ
jgi:hypothetical protein